MHSSNLTTIKRLYDLFNRRKWEEITSLYSDKTQFLDTRIGDRFISFSKTDLASRHAAVVRKYRGLHEQILYIEESGNQVFVQYLLSGVTRDKKRWEQLAWNIFTIEQGKIAKVAVYFSRP